MKKGCSLACKTAALLALIAAILIMCLGLGLIVTADSFGMYGREPMKETEELLQAQVRTSCRIVADEYVFWRLNGGEEPGPYGASEEFLGKGNFRYQILDRNGEVLRSTYDGEAARVTVEMTPEDCPGVSQVRGYLLEELTADDMYSLQLQLLSFTAANRYSAIVLFAVGLLAAVLLQIYLFSAAGHRSGREGIVMGLPDKLPLECSLAVSGAGVWVLVRLGIEAIMQLKIRYTLWLPAIEVTACAVGAILLIEGVLLTLAIRYKAGHGYLWRRTLVGGTLYWGWRYLRKLISLLPVCWRWLMAGGGMLAALAVSWPAYWYNGELWYPALVLMSAALLCYAAISFGMLRKEAAALAAGELDRQVDLRHLHGEFRAFGQDLNDLGKGAGLAVSRQMRSERMKTELITNVSHDIKTPLTSIVNYVDLLQKPHTPEQQEEYLAVLARQAQRLKKLTVDLVEMSKASTGNLAVSLQRTDAVEILNQALGEYAERLEAGRLEPVLTAPDSGAWIMADGRLLWRVMDNLLNNVLKYALPGTRVYFDVTQYEKKVMISVKNVSRARLNIPADELMERFVRGDAARNAEGSGLGLNIAKSLTELQKGQLNLVIDGDLFKAVLLFDPLPPQAAEQEKEPEE